MRATSVLRHSPWDGTLVALALLHGALLTSLIARPLPGASSIALVALGLWWNANTISHTFIHLPFFSSRRANGVFSAFLTVLLGFPHHLWRARHLAHHAGREGRSVKWTRPIVFEALLVAALWTSLAILVPQLFFFVYLPGYLIGLALCQLQGYFEHAHGTTSHYGRVYNALFFNDGLHVEHHEKPSKHWSRLRPSGFGEASPPTVGAASAGVPSAWPPVLRWMDEVPSALDALERLVLRSSVLQSLVLGPHQTAIGKCLSVLPPLRRVTIIGGGLFPRTAIILRRLAPAATITIIDRNPRHLESARRFLGSSVVTVQADCDAARAFDADLVIVPLAYVGDRNAFYENPPTAAVIVHDWIWRRRGQGRRVSWWLLKRVNLVLRRRTAISRGRSAA